MRGSDWTVGEAAVHLVVVARAFAATAAGQAVGPAGGRKPCLALRYKRLLRNP
jgi:hypothetical protein